MSVLESIPMNRVSPWSGRETWSGRSSSSDEISSKLAKLCELTNDSTQDELSRRHAIALRYAEILKANAARLAELISEEVGKTFAEANAEVTTAIGKVQASIDALAELRSTRKNNIGEVRFKPIGVMFVLGPFNFPLHLPGSHMVPAILAGNRVLFKPSEFAPAVGESLVNYWYEAGLTEHDLQLVQGSARVAQEAIDDLRVNGVLFTGSRKAGVAIHRQLSGRPEVLLALEMGGNNALIVAETEDIDNAVDIAIQSAFITSGQRCSCARRILITEGKHSQSFIDAFLARARNLSVGLPTDNPHPFVGPLVHSQAVQTAVAFQQRWIDAGGRPLLFAKQSDRCAALMSPGIIDITDVRPVFDEECFAPLVTLMRVNDLTEAIKQAKNTVYGLSLGMIGGNEAEFEFVAESISAGVMNWNKPTTGASARLPFGGFGASGNHRASAYFAAEYCSDPVAIQKERKKGSGA